MVDSSLLHTFNVSVLTDYRRYTGSFTTKKLSVRDFAQLGVRKVQLNGGLHFNPEMAGHGVDKATDELNTMIAHLELALVEYPEWWNLDELTDLTVLSEVYGEVISFENSFLGRRKTSGDKGAGGSSEADSTSAQSEANDAGPVAQVVGSEVQSALEP